MTERSKYNLGISRNRLPDYVKIKGRKSMAKKRFSKDSLRKDIDEEELVKSTLLSYSTKTSEIELADLQEPEWMGDYRRCLHYLAQVDGIMDEVKEEKAKKMSAVNEEKHRKIIEKLYEAAANKIGQTEKILKGIEKVSALNSTPEQRKILSNTLMSLAMRMREKTKDIRLAQQQDLRQRKQLQQFEINRFQGSHLMNKDLQEEGEFISEEDFQAFQQTLSNERNQQILKLVSSIHSLNAIYKQLQDVVIEQGSLLDRIDMNIETTAKHIEQANVHLEEAEKHQKSPLANRVIFVLVLLIVCFVLILANR